MHAHTHTHTHTHKVRQIVTKYKTTHSCICIQRFCEKQFLLYQRLEPVHVKCQQLSVMTQLMLLASQHQYDPENKKCFLVNIRILFLPLLAVAAEIVAYCYYYHDCYYYHCCTYYCNQCCCYYC